jgi:hypothetical protein
MFWPPSLSPTKVLVTVNISNNQVPRATPCTCGWPSPPSRH